MSKPPLSLQLHQSLRRKIILGDYAQGEVLSETRLAEDLSVSRVPVREVLPMLQQEGFIETAPRRRSIVAAWTAERIHQLFDARLGVEVAAAGAAAVRVRTTGDLAPLEAAMELAEKPASGEPLDVALATSAMHVALVAASGNPLFDELMRVLSGRMAWLSYLTSPRDVQGQSHEHHAIFDAIRDGNRPLAESLTFAHIESGRQPTLAVLGMDTVHA